MLRFTANYARTNHNFVIQNLDSKPVNDKFLPALCVVKNILQRGKPTLMSLYLQEHLGKIHEESTFKTPLPLIFNEPPRWLHRIRGDDKNNYYPARNFFYDVIPNYLAEYCQIQQLMLPEASINEITQIDVDDFVDQRVDFLLPQAKLIIEIDGQHHKRHDRTKINDSLRDKHLAAYGFMTIRIPTRDLERKNDGFLGKIKEIRNRLKAYNRIISIYRKPHDEPLAVYDKDAAQHKLIPTAVIRFQILILELLERGKLRCDAPSWKFNVLERDVSNFVGLAAEDICLWLEHICRLQRISYQKPIVQVSEMSEEKNFSYQPDAVNIDFSLLRRWTDENELHPQVITVRTDYFDYLGGNRDYCRINTTDPVTYDILPYGDNKDIDLLRFFLKNIFSLEDFKEGQLRIITNALSLRDTIGLLPTSGGKSLCYQLASLLQPSVSLVVCPIKSLMYDQKYNLDRVFINSTAYITSDLDAATKSKVASDFARGRYLWIWLSPERMQSEDFRAELMALNKNLTISYAVIDEVHCLSEWGHDFRTSYLNLAKTVRKILPNAKFLGLTATASVNVLKDIKIEFGIQDENVKTLTLYTRPELEFHIIDDLGDKYNKTLSLLRQMDKEEQILQLREDATSCGLMFTPNVNGNFGCYDIANTFSASLGVDVKWYSGKVPKKKGPNGSKVPVMRGKEFDSYKIQTQNAFHENKFPLLVATKAFGMGVNKTNIRYTIHYGIPGSMESLYQEAGRAGRDGRPAHCYIVFSQEKTPKDALNSIFGLETRLETIRDINEKVGRNGRDVFRILYLWLSQQQDIDAELNMIRKLMLRCPPNSTQMLDASTFMDGGKNTADSARVLVEKAIYRLSILGIINDWTIADWFRGIFKVEVGYYDQTTIRNHLVAYIKKYDPQFIYEKKVKLYTERDETDQTILILINWIYDHFAYNRRQSIKTVYEKCSEFKMKGPEGSAWFKQELETMFKFSEVTYNLDEIAENPTDFEKWFSIFYLAQNTGMKEIITIDKLDGIKSSLARFLESFQFNTGLNFISGLIRLMLGDFDNTDGRPRMISALQQVAEMDEDIKRGIFINILEIGGKLDNSAREELGTVLEGFFNGNEVEIYEALEDTTSLTVILGNANQRLTKIGSVLYDCCEETAEHH